MTEIGRDFRRLQSFDEIFSDPGQGNVGHPSAADNYFFDRVSGSTGVTLLDLMPAYVASEFCVVLGKIDISLDSWPDLERASSSASFELRRRGYSVASVGVECLTNLLYRASEVVKDNPGARSKVYAPILEWAAQHRANDDYIFALRILQEHVEKAVRGKHGSIEVRPAVSSIRDYIEIQDAANSLGCSTDTVRDLLRAGVLTLFTEDSLSRVNLATVSNADVAGLQAKLDDISDVGAPKEHWRSLEAIFRRRWYRVVELLPLILRGAVTCTRPTASPAHLVNLYVDLSEVRAAVKASRALTKQNNRVNFCK